MEGNAHSRLAWEADGCQPVGQRLKQEEESQAKSETVSQIKSNNQANERNFQNLVGLSPWRLYPFEGVRPS